MDNGFNSDDIAHFILSFDCPKCQTKVEADLTRMGETGEPGFRNVSLLCRSPTVRVGYSPTGSIFYAHRSCGSLLTPEQARPILDNLRQQGEKA